MWAAVQPLFKIGSHSTQQRSYKKKKKMKSTYEHLLQRAHKWKAPVSSI